MLEKVTIELVNVTAQIAKNWLVNNDYEYQRNLRNRYVDSYASEIRRNHWKQYTMIEFAYINGRKLLMDGQHRLSAIVKSGLELPLYVQHRYYNDIASVAADYARTDIHRARNWSDVVNALHESLGLKERIVLTNSDINVLKTSFDLIYRGFMSDGMRVDFVTMYEKTLEWQPYAKTYFDIVGNNSGDNVCKALRRKHIAAMAIATIRFADYHLPSHISAIDFWRQVARGHMLGMNDPRQKLRELFLTSRVQSTPSQSKNYTAKELLLYTTRAWEAFCNGNEIKRLVFPRSTSVSIKHTPFNGSMSTSQFRTCFERGDWGKEWPST